jgi:lia operon protein LiaG
VDETDRRTEPDDDMMLTTRFLMRTAAAALPVAAAATILPPPAHGQQTERFSLTGSRVAVHNLVGEVRVERGSGSAVVVEVTRGGADAGELRVSRATVDGHDAVRIAYPAGELVYPRLGARSRSQMTVGRDGVYGSRGGPMGRRVSIRGSGSGTEAWADVRILVPAGREVMVHQGLGRVEVSGTDGSLRVNTSSASVTTRSTRGTLFLDTGSGSVSVTDADGDLTADTGSGSVRVSGVRGGRVRLDTGSGSVGGSGVRAGNLVVDTGSGSVNLTEVTAGRLLVDTGSGSVRLGLEGSPEDARIDTGSGSVTLTVPQDYGARVTVSTGSGGIHVDVPATVRRSARREYEGTLGDGRGRLVIDTGSGAVRIRN